MCDDKNIVKLILLTRKKMAIDDSRVIQIITDLEKISLQDYGIDYIDAGLCALGTTIKVAGSQEAFRKVDHDYVINVAKVCLALLKIRKCFN